MKHSLKLGQAEIDGRRRIIVVREGQTLVLGEADGAPKTALEIVAGCAEPSDLSTAIEDALDRLRCRRKGLASLCTRRLDRPTFWSPIRRSGSVIGVAPSPLETDFAV